VEISVYSCALVVRNLWLGVVHAKKSSQDATNLTYSSADLMDHRQKDFGDKRMKSNSHKVHNGHNGFRKAKFCAFVTAVRDEES
jgi:hypothetical protein